MCYYLKERILKVSSIHILLPQIFNMYQPWNSSSQAEESAANAEWREYHSAFMYMSPQKDRKPHANYGKTGNSAKTDCIRLKNDHFFFSSRFKI